jgi:hypothetical protein
MNAFNGTPGPWEVGETLRADELAVIGDGDSVVCEFPDRIGASVDADARLIAAAPCLLDALQRLNSATRRYMEERPVSDAEWASDEPSVLSIVDAAIAKATGGTP